MTTTPLPFAAFPLHYETGRHSRRVVFLDDATYAGALDALVKGCTDLLLEDPETGHVLLGKRRVHPQPDWWYGCGGRMRPGESPYESAARTLKRELGIALSEADTRHVDAGGRFEGVGAYSYAWEMREQPPKNHGTADISVVLCFRVTPAERAAFRIDAKEYEAHEWVDPAAVVADETKHPALRQSVSDLLARRAWRAVKDAVNKPGTSDAEIGRMVRSLVEKGDAASPAKKARASSSS